MTPASPITGLKKYKDAQFVTTGSTGKRITLFFSVLGHDFSMHAYVWGAQENEAQQRMVAVHGISPGVSRTRWHAFGDRIQNDTTNDKMRFVALDWHSLDRTDAYQEEFLTMLPKHILSVPSDEALQQEFVDMYPQAQREWIKGFFKQVKECCPRSTQQGGHILRAVIEQGLGWGVQEKPFVLGVKSWSGGIGVAMLSDAAQDDNDSFRRNIRGAVVMHLACFLDETACANAVKDLPVLMCWAENDPLMSYKLSSRYLVHDGVKLVTYDSGGHANFDGSDELPNFDGEILVWLEQELD